MSHISHWMSGIGMLIFVYLVLSHGDETASIIKTLGTTGVSGIKALQGRS